MYNDRPKEKGQSKDELNAAKERARERIRNALSARRERTPMASPYGVSIVNEWKAKVLGCGELITPHYLIATYIPFKRSNQGSRKDKLSKAKGSNAQAVEGHDTNKRELNKKETAQEGYDKKPWEWRRIRVRKTGGCENCGKGEEDEEQTVKP